jgi:hypothetical protein
VSADGSVVLISAPLDSGGGEGRGAVWAFEHTASGWIERGEFKPSDEVGPQEFGNTIAMSADGRLALIGGAKGTVWVFECAGGAWVQRGPQFVLGETHQGGSLALSADGNTALFGVPGFGEYSSGAAWVYRRSGSSFAPVQQFLGSTATRYVHFGSGVALNADGTTALISAPGEFTHLPAGGGAAWFFAGPPWGAPPTGGGAPGISSAGAAPIITNFKESHRRWREGHKLARISRRAAAVPVGTTFSFRLNEAVAVTLVFAQRLAGRRVNRRCLPASRHKLHGRTCSRTLVRGALLFEGHAGLNQVAFEGRITRHRWLPAGSYIASIAARNAAGQRSAKAALGFEIGR